MLKDTTIVLLCDYTGVVGQLITCLLDVSSARSVINVMYNFDCLNYYNALNFESRVLGKLIA